MIKISRLFDLIVLFVLLPTWLLCFALMARDVIRGTAYPFVTADYEETNPFPVVYEDHPAASDAARFRVGDVMLRWGDRSLEGADQAAFTTAVESQTPSTHVALVTVRRGEETIRLHVRTGDYRTFWPRLIAALVFMGVALILQYRSPRSALTRSFGGMCFGGALLFVCTFAGRGWLVHLADAVQMVGLSGLSAFAIRGFSMFPHGESPRSRWLRALPWLFVLTGPIDLERSTGLLMPTAAAYYISLALSLAENALICVMLGLSYRRSAPIERRMIKWVVWGVYIAFAVPTVMALSALLDLTRTHLFYVSAAWIAIIPVTLLIATRRFNLFDINHVLSLTALYSTAIAIVLVSSLLGLPRLAATLGRSVDLPSSVVEVGLSALLVAIVMFAYRSLRPQLERTFFRERRALEQSTPALAQQLRAAATPAEALAALAQGLWNALRITSLSVYCRSETSWDNVAALGPAIAPALRQDSEFIRMAEHDARLLNLERGHARAIAFDRDYDRALAAALGLSLIIPITRAERAFAVIFLGRKISGDVYVASELALLEALSHVLSERLASFELTTIVRDARQLHEQMKRYVPGAVAEALADGEQLDAKQCDVTLMFVDIRGYSGYSEGRAPSEVFSRLNEYTECVSALVRQHGGQVIEFNGDGMMAVFGAPRPMIEKEQSAVAAALAIHVGVAAMADVRDEAPLAVGIGIATGDAYVGSLRAVDRWIWTAIGETTNRAARLQSLTRELSAAVIVDESTWRRLGSEEAVFVAHRGHKLRGLQQRHNLFALPLDGIAARSVGAAGATSAII
ncbi:MAG TPA: adenylate/guanylate cyclase domain-containing protein [Polyangiales bacterium]|jgi:class 3 adenylate cyclase